MRAKEFLRETEKSLTPPTINVGDEVRVGKYKNKRAEVKGFTKDENNQPVLKTNKGDQKLFKPRLAKLMDPVNEARVGGMLDDDARALPATYAIPKLPNQDPYKQYRFGVALAAAKGKAARAKEGAPNFSPATVWGENQIVVSYDPDIGKWIDDALEMVGLKPSDKVMISTRASEEPIDTDTVSPVKGFKGYPR